MTTTTTPQPTCSKCGSTDAEDVSNAAIRDNDGYSTCCNEPVDR